MKVFKFGGASVRDAKAVQNVASILGLYADENLCVVISAMGKTTNALEEVIQACWDKKAYQFETKTQEIKDYHQQIIQDLGLADDHTLSQNISSVFQVMQHHFEAPAPDNFDFLYDQIVGLGEVLSTWIVDAYLRLIGMDSQWLDARQLIRTDNRFRDADIDWKKTELLLKIATEQHKSIYIIQGFIGHTPELLTTTLGREGSDFTAAIVAYCLDAEEVSIWKDVPGMLNADPKQFENTIKLDRISFNEALELAYYGASVIHPKTIKPLQNKGISLHVRSFNDPSLAGTEIQSLTTYDALIPSYIMKDDQMLVSFKTRDFSFIIESHLGDIFNRLSKLGVKIQIMQNTALSFSIVVDAKRVAIHHILEEFGQEYEVRYNTGLQLLTIRHYTDTLICSLVGEKEILMQQYSRSTARIILKP